jgi:hypothetical protein
MAIKKMDDGDYKYVSKSFSQNQRVYNIDDMIILLLEYRKTPRDKRRRITDTKLITRSTLTRLENKCVIYSTDDK